MKFATLLTALLSLLAASPASAAWETEAAVDEDVREYDVDELRDIIVDASKPFEGGFTWRSSEDTPQNWWIARWLQQRQRRDIYAHPSSIFVTGFIPRITLNQAKNNDQGALNLTHYVRHNTPSVFISTTVYTDNKMWEPNSYRIYNAFRYDIFAPGGIDVNPTLGQHHFYAQNEIAFIGGVQTKFIYGALEYDKYGIPSRFHINPNYEGNEPDYAGQYKKVYVYYNSDGSDRHTTYFNNDGTINNEVYYNTDGKIRDITIYGKDGFAHLTNHYNDNKKVKRITYYSNHGSSISGIKYLNSDGTVNYIKSFNNDGFLKSIEYCNKDHTVNNIKYFDNDGFLKSIKYFEENTPNYITYYKRDGSESGRKDLKNYSAVSKKICSPPYSKIKKRSAAINNKTMETIKSMAYSESPGSFCYKVTVQSISFDEPNKVGLLKPYGKINVFIEKSSSASIWDVSSKDIPKVMKKLPVRIKYAFLKADISSNPRICFEGCVHKYDQEFGDGVKQISHFTSSSCVKTQSSFPSKKYSLTSSTEDGSVEIQFKVARCGN